MGYGNLIHLFCGNLLVAVMFDGLLILYSLYRNAASVKCTVTCYRYVISFLEGVQSIGIIVSVCLNVFTCA